MRWDALFNDLETQLADYQRQDLDAEIAERALADAAAVLVSDRLRGSVGLGIRIHLASGAVFDGELSHAGSEALVLDQPRHQLLVPYAAVLTYHGLSRMALAEPSVVRQRLGLASALRGLAAGRERIDVLLAGGPEAALPGFIDRVGRDYFDLAEAACAGGRHPAGGRKLATIPFTSLIGVRSVRSLDS